MDSEKPRVVIIGAGMAGITAANHLCQAKDNFNITILEASHRIGGRIKTSEIGGNRVELGATWIHGIEGSPLYNLAQETGCLLKSIPFERQDGFPEEPIVKAEGGLTVNPSIVKTVMPLYKNLLSQIRSNGELLSTEEGQSIGAFVIKAFNECVSGGDGNLDWHKGHPAWNEQSLREALITLNENMERIATSANTLFDLDAHAEQEYTDYGGEHITIAAGYTSILSKLGSPLPSELFQFGKKVEKIEWDLPLTSSKSPILIHCSDGSTYEADHVIVTVSLGVLKASIEHDFSDQPWSKPDGRHVSRSLDDLQSGICHKTPSLFEPPLPLPKIEAISKLGYGVVDKIFLKLNTEALSPSQLQVLSSHIQLIYKQDKQSDIPRWMRKTFSMAPIYRGSNVLLCWFAGGEALEMETLSDEEVMEGVTKTLASFGLVTKLFPTSTTKSYSNENSSSGSDWEVVGLHRHRVSTNSISTKTLPSFGQVTKPFPFSTTSSCSNEYSSSGSDWEDVGLGRPQVGTSSSGGDSSEEHLDDEEDEGDGNLTKCHGTLFSGVLRSKWGRDPLFNGSYSFVATGASGVDIEKLAEPLPMNSVCLSHKPPLQLLFAGEATERHFYSTTHGAYLSGVREANRLLSHYNVQSIKH